MKTHALLRDIANTDYTIEKLRELAPAALVGEQNFFVAYGLHKVHCYILIIPVLFLMILFFLYGSFFQPHQPWDCPAEFYDLYPEEVVGLPANPYVPEVIG